MKLKEIIDEKMGPNYLANIIVRKLFKYKTFDHVQLCGRNGITGIGIPYNAVKLEIQGKKFLIEIKEMPK